MVLDALRTMSKTMLSSSWYRVSALRPALRNHAQIHRHRFRGEVWFVLSDPASGRTHRFTSDTRLLLSGMDGQRTVGQLWDLAHRRLGDDAPTQDEFIQLLGQLHAADLIQCDVNPDVSELFERAQKHDRAKARQAFGNPLSIKLRLFDPDRWLNRMQPWVRPIWNRVGVLAWLALVVPALVAAGTHWSELTGNLSDHVLATNNLVMIALLFPLIKLAHELGHGLAVKMRGGEVHDVGVMLLILMPVPYVDGSAATAFKSKWDRALVGAAGMLVELVLAAVAMYVWLIVEPGTVRALAYNVMLVAGVSTVIFNGNPLLRYDGYYILADLIEIPNLAQRANQYLGYLVERHVFKAPDLQPPVISQAEGRWFLFYAPAAFFYRTIVSLGIAMFLAGQFLIIGVLLAGWALATSMLIPAWRLALHLVNSPSLARVRRRAYLIAMGGGTLLVAGLLLVPLPYWTMAEGVVWLPEQAIVRSGDGCFVVRFLAASGELVKKGQPLMQCDAPELMAQWRLSQGRVNELEARFGALFVDDRVAAEVLRDSLQHERAVMNRLEERVASLVVRSPIDGRLIVPQAADMLGRFFRKGDQLAFVTDKVQPIVRVVVPQSDVDLVRQSNRRITVRRTGALDQLLEGRIVREVPAGDLQLPSLALTVQGGGQLPADPRDSKGLTTLNRTFQFDVELSEQVVSRFGGRVYVRFDHNKTPLAIQWYRSVRPVFLSRFHA